MRFNKRALPLAVGAAILTISGVVTAAPANAYSMTSSGCQTGTVTSGDWYSYEARSTEFAGNVAADLSPNTGLSGCSGVFPGGTLYLRIDGCAAGSSGYTYRAFTYAGRKDIATGVASGACFLIGEKGTARVGTAWKARIIWPQPK